MTDEGNFMDQPVEGVNGEALQRLLDYIDDEQAKRCRQILHDAQEEASSILREAWRQSREQVHHAVEGEKHRRKREVERARAEVRSRLRRAWFHLVRRELDQAWPLIRERLISHWQSSVDNRRAWLSAALDTAVHTLGPGLWHLEHPGDWKAEEGELVFSDLREKYEVLDIRCHPAEHEAGFAVSCSDVTVSATLEGVVSRRSRIEGILLARLYREDAMTLASLMADEEFLK